MLRVNIIYYTFPLLCNGLFGLKAQNVKDIDGNNYKTAAIGTQIWMVENLKTTRYNNGDSIGTINPITLDITTESTPKYQWAYDGNENNISTYGRLYTWFAACDIRNVCPSGWHVPTDVSSNLQCTENGK
jgi:uncharacterized protein (TIGR02145 family)